MKLYLKNHSILLPVIFLMYLPISFAVTQEAALISEATIFDLKPMTSASITFQSLEQMDQLVQLEMPALALRLLILEQKKWPIYSQNWYVLERKHIALLAAIDDWQRIVQRIDLLLQQAILGKQITRRVSQWFSTQQVMARLKLGQSEMALSQLRALLWHSSITRSPSNNTDIIALWRRLVIRAYLAMNNDKDVQKSLLRYQHDYSQHKNLNLDWRLLQARSLLRADRADEVVPLLSGLKSHLAQAIRMLAALRSRPDNAELYAQDIQAYINRSILNEDEIWAYRYVIYQTYLIQKKLNNAVQVLKTLLLRRNAYSVLGEEFTVSSDDWWGLYEAIGMKIANRAKMLLGDDSSWYKKAEKLEKDNKIEALSLYVVLAFNSSDMKKQQMAHEKIVALLKKDLDGFDFISLLYLQAKKIPSLKSLPLDVRYNLLDYALSKGNLKLAVRLMTSIQKPPEGLDEFSWAMRKARVMVLDGAYLDGESVLSSEIKNAEEITQKQLDQFLQVIFDLQAVARHLQVLNLLGSLKQEWMTPTIHRELFFWKAESYAELKQYDRAALSYLNSAQLADQAQAVLWAQSARFKAAGVLVKSALYNDAEVIYKRLLEITVSDSRRATIKQELQQIRLLRNAEKNTAKNH